MIVKKMVIILALFVTNINMAYDKKAQKECQSENEVYVFSWTLSNECDDKPRGGTSKGVDVVYDTNAHKHWQAIQQQSLTKFEKDRLAILAMQGAYRVDFNFLETVGFSENYQRDTPYHSWGTEYVYVVEDTNEFISLQHIMVIYMKKDDGTSSDPFVMKHWRQDWTYQDSSLLTYQGNNRWKKQKISQQDNKGTWSQAVFQVDDSPRYESYGKWQHNNAFSSWISQITNRPLPRREYSVRTDYQILEGFNRHTINRFGWVQEEENWKKVLHDNAEKNTYVAKEEGIGRYRTIVGTDFTPGDVYWEATSQFWKDVRLGWKEIIDQADETLSLHKKVDGQSLFMPLFTYASQVQEKGQYDAKEGQAYIRSTLSKYVNKGE